MAFQTCVSGSREQTRCTARNHDGVLIVRGEAAVGRAIGPAILAERNVAGAGRNDWFDSDDQARGQFVLRGEVRVIGHRRRLVNGAADAVAAQLLDDVKAPSAPSTLDTTPDVLAAV